MKQNKFDSCRGAGAVALGVAVLMGLCSCGDDEGKKQETAQQAVPAASQQQVQPVACRDALFDAMVYGVGRKVSGMAAVPELTEDVRNMLVLLQSYYDEMAPSNAGKVERARLALRIAEVLRDLTAWDKALAAYETAQADFDALPDGEKQKAEAKRMQSAIYDGQGFCLLRRNQVAEAQASYEKSLAIYQELYKAVAPADGEKLPEGELDPALSQAAEDLFFSYRCLGECQMVADDPEEARETYKKGIELAQRLDRLSPRMTIQYVRLLGNQGNLESSCGHEREALANWVQAAQICQRLYSSTPNLGVRAQASRLFQNLRPQIQELARKLQSEEAARAVEEQPLPSASETATGGEAAPAS